MTCLSSLLALAFTALALLLGIRGPLPGDWRAKYSGGQVVMFGVAWTVALMWCSAAAIVAVRGWPT